MSLQVDIIFIYFIFYLLCIQHADIRKRSSHLGLDFKIFFQDLPWPANYMGTTIFFFESECFIVLCNW